MHALAAMTALVVLTANTAAADAARPLLVTADQLAALEKAVAGGPIPEGVRPAVIGLRGSSDGPRVALLRPGQGAAVKAPVEVEIRFERRNSPVELQTVQVWYVLKKGEFEFEVDVTAQVRPHLRPDGLRLWIPDAAPKGEHRVRLAVEDREGRRTQERFSLELR